MSSAANIFVAPLRPGDLAPESLVGHWRVEHELGRGGMGTVYAVVHTQIGKRAALKVIHQHALTPEYDAARFLTEARAVNAVSHPNIVDIFESGTLPDGRPYLVMERLHGKTLGDRQDQGRVPALEVIDYLVPLCDALAAAHTAGIVHRDIKLDNVFLVDANCTQIGAGGGPTVKLLDWGIASMVNVDGERSYGNLMVGTPRYVAPEQARGERVTTASDVYSLGVVAYELFLEEAPFNASSAAELLVQHLTEAPPMPHEVWPTIPTMLEDLLLAMLAKTPALRPTVTQVAETLIDLRNELRRAVAVSGSGPHAIPVETSAPRAMPQPFVRALTPSGLGHEPTQVGTNPAIVLPPERSWRSWRWGAAIAMIAVLLGIRMFVSGGAPSAKTAAAAAAAAVPSTEIASAPAPMLLTPDAAEEVATPATAAAPTAAKARPAARRTATAATTTPTAPRDAAPRPARKATRGKLHPDAVIDPY